MTHDKPEPPDMRGDNDRISTRRLIYELHVELARLRTSLDEKMAGCLSEYDTQKYAAYIDAKASCRTLTWVIGRISDTDL